MSHASIVVPFLLGAALALPLYPRLDQRRVGFTVFALFLGVSMSVTAFPVLARILSDKGLHKTDARHARAHLRRRRRRHGVVPARVRRERRAGDASPARSSRVGLTLVYIGVMFVARAARGRLDRRRGSRRSSG